MTKNEEPKNIQIKIAVQDPNTENGDTIHQQYEITEKELEMVLPNDQEYLQAVIRHMGSSIAKKWSK